MRTGFSRVVSGILAAVAVLCVSPRLMAAGPDETAVRAVLMAQFDKPEARLQVQPVVVVGQTAIASWVQQERGGRALLFRKQGQWHIAACGGDGFKDARALQDAGVSAQDARALVQALNDEEARLPAGQRAKFSTFQGVLPLDATGTHPPHGAHPHH